MNSAFVKNQSVSINYQILNPENSGTPIVFIPGMVNSADECFEALAEHTERQIIFISLRGRGKSESPEVG